VATYRQALIYGVLSGLASWLGIAATDNATLATAAPYAAAAGVVIALGTAAAVAYRSGQPPRRDRS